MAKLSPSPCSHGMVFDAFTVRGLIDIRGFMAEPHNSFFVLSRKLGFHVCAVLLNRNISRDVRFCRNRWNCAVFHMLYESIWYEYEEHCSGSVLKI